MYQAVYTQYKRKAIEITYGTRGSILIEFHSNCQVHSQNSNIPVANHY